MKKIAFLLIGEIKYDGRVQKEIKTLQNHNFTIELIVSNFTDDDKKNYSFEIRSLGYIESKNPLLNFLSIFGLNKKMYKILKNINPDFVHCNDLNTLIAGYFYKKKNKSVKIIYDAHELYPESQKNKLRENIWGFIEKKVYSSADEIIMPEKNRAVYFGKKYKLEKSIKIIPNYPLKKSFNNNENPRQYETLELDNLTKILYIGYISPNRDLEKIVSSILELPDNYCMILMGPFSKGYKPILKNFLIDYSLSNRVFVLDPVPNDEVISYIKASDIGVVFYQNTNLNNYYCASNKLFEFIANKKPVITNDYPGLLDVVKKNNYGVCINELTSSKIADAILKANDIRIDTEPEYYWDNFEDSFSTIYN